MRSGESCCDRMTHIKLYKSGLLREKPVNAVKMKALKTNGVIHQRSLTSCLPDHGDFSRFSRCIPVFSTVKICSLPLPLSTLFLFRAYAPAAWTVRILPSGPSIIAFPYARGSRISRTMHSRGAVAYRNKCTRCKYTARISASARELVLICVTKRDIQIPTCSQYARPLAIIRVAWSGTSGWARRRQQRRQRRTRSSEAPIYRYAADVREGLPEIT